MSKKDKRIPIYLSNKNDWLLLMLIVISSDNSIYFSFPRKKGYYLSKLSEKTFYKGESRMTQREFIELSKKYENPKISFHPGKMAVHISAGEYKVKKDYDVLNIAPNGMICCELLQVIFPLSEDIYDSFIKKKYHDNRFVINGVGKLRMNGGLFSINVIIHSSSFIPNPNMHPVKEMKYLTSATFNSGKDITITIAFFSHKKVKKNMYNDIVLNINTLKKSVIYVMSPK